MLTLVPGGMGGSETYAREVVAQLVHRPEIEVTVLVPPAAAGSLGGAREVVVDRVSGGAGTLARVRSLAQAMAPGSRARAALDEAEVVHYLLTVPAPAPRDKAHVVTLLDVQHHDLPEMFGRAERAYRSFAYDRAASRADRVMTISEFSRERIVERLGLAQADVEVAPLAVDLERFTRGAEHREGFVYYPAAAWPHKNHKRLVEAIVLLRQRRPGLKLVLTGAGRERLGALPEWVEHRGQVSLDEVRDLYRTAGCMAFPSLYEGFGLPPLEAMASGCPVASSTAGSLREVCGDVASYFDPLSPTAIADAIDESLTTGSIRSDLGTRRAARFTWKACADVHARTYVELARRV